MKRLRRSTIPSLFLAIFLLLAGSWSPVLATNLTGTFKNPDGSLVNGKLIFLLSQPARLNDSSAQIVPMVKIFSVTNGILESGAFVFGNDVLVPTGTYYLVRLVDANNNLLFEQKWSIVGTNLDLGTLTPTTAGVVVPDPLLKNVSSTQAVQGPVTFSSGVTAFSLTLNGNLNPGTADAYDLGSTTLPWNKLSVGKFEVKGGRPWFDVRAYGAKGDNSTNDLTAFQSAINGCTSPAVGQEGGTVYVPPAAQYVLNGTLTFAAPIAGRYCVLRLAAPILTNQTITLPPTGWSIEGDYGVGGTQPSFIHGAPVALINSNGTQNPLLKVGDGVSAVARVTLKNIAVAGNAVGDGIVIEGKGGGNITLDGVFALINPTANGDTLVIKDALQIFIRNSSLGGPTDGATLGTKHTIRLTGTAAGTNVGPIRIYDTVLHGRGLKVDRQVGPGSSIGNVLMQNVLYETYQESLITFDSTNASGGIITCIRCEGADLASGDPALITTKTVNTINSIILIDSLQPTGGWWAETGTNRPTNLIVMSGQNGVIYNGRDGYVGNFIANGGWSGRIVNATSGVDSQDVSLLGGQVSVNMATPINLTVSPLLSGGTLADGSYRYVVTALNGITSPCDNREVACGPAPPYESWVSKEVTCTITGGGGAGRCSLNWDDVPGAASYRIYGRGAYASGAQNKTLFFTATVSDFIDTGAAGTAGSVPKYSVESGNAPVVRWSAKGDSFVGQGNTGFGTFTPGAKVDVVGKVRTTTQFESTQATGTPPHIVASTTEVSNLNPQRWHGKQAIDFSGTLDFPSIAAQTCSDLTITATGAAANNPVAPSWPVALEAGLAGTMFVSAADTVKVRLCNVTILAVDPASQTFAGRVIQ